MEIFLVPGFLRFPRSWSELVLDFLNFSGPDGFGPSIPAELIANQLVSWNFQLESRLRNAKLKTHRAFANLLDIIPLLKNTDDDFQNEDYSILLELYERNLAVINGADVELVADDNNIDEN